MAERKPSIYRYGYEKVEISEKGWEFLVEAMQGQPVEQRVHTAGPVEAAWKASMDWYMLSGDAKRDHLERELDNISMDGDEDPKLFFDHAEGRPNVLSTLRTHKSDRDVVRLITRRLPSESYDVEQRTSLLRPGITPSEMEEIVSRTSYANRKTKMLEERKFALIVSTSAALVDPNALAAAGGFQGNSGGGRFGGTRQQQQSQQRFGGTGQQPRRQQQYGGAG